MTTPEKRQLTFSNFNQDNSCISVVSSDGYRVYRCEPFAKSYESHEGGMAIVEMLFTTSLITLVGSGEHASFSPRRIRLFNTRTEKYICELNFVSTVLNVKLNKSRMAAVLENKIHIFDLKSMKILIALDTARNPLGLCALSGDDRRCYLAYPASEDRGELLIYDAQNLQVVSVVHAHQTPVRHFGFNREGNLLATASTKGTVIRVFSIPDGRKLHTFRRGSYPATIFSFSFNPSSTLLGVTSDSSTVHIFDLSGADKPTPVQSAASTISSYLPNVLQDMVEPSRSFATISIKDNVPPTVCAFKGDHTIMIVTSGGFFYRYTVPREGGECKLEAEYSLLNAPSEAMGVKFHDVSPVEQTDANVILEDVIGESVPAVVSATDTSRGKEVKSDAASVGSSSASAKTTAPAPTPVRKESDTVITIPAPNSKQPTTLLSTLQSSNAAAAKSESAKESSSKAKSTPSASKSATPAAPKGSESKT